MTKSSETKTKAPKIIKSNPLHPGLGSYYTQISRFPLLTRDEEYKLAKIAMTKGKKSKPAKQELIEKNLRLVISIASDYQNMGVDLDDLISEGNIGLTKGVERFNPDKGAKLSSYAAWWIRQYIRRSITNQGKTIRVPSHIRDKLAKLRDITQKMSIELGREPTVEEISEETLINPDRINKLLDYVPRITHLDAPLEQEGSKLTVGDLIPDETAVSPQEQSEYEGDKSLLLKMIKTLPEREQTILKGRFGLDNTKIETLETLGKKLKLTRERIRQIQEEILLELRKKMNKNPHHTIQAYATEAFAT